MHWLKIQNGERHRINVNRHTFMLLKMGRKLKIKLLCKRGTANIQAEHMKGEHRNEQNAATQMARSTLSWNKLRTNL